eukprot:SAG11_NODE_25746_length_354_cov_1.490196_1_plen_57_part_01
MGRCDSDGGGTAAAPTPEARWRWRRRRRSLHWEMAQQGDRIGPIRTESDEEDWLEAY